MIKKKLPFLFFILLFLSYTPLLKAGGSGEVTLSALALENFEKYISGKTGTPVVFALSPSGKYFNWGYCAKKYGGRCVTDGWPKIKQDCTRWAKKDNANETCFIFAKKRKIVWNNSSNQNYIKVSRKINKEDLHELLYKNNFLKDNNEVPTYDSDNTDMIEQIKNLNKLYNQGVLTKDEFQKAKKKLLN